MTKNRKEMKNKTKKIKNEEVGYEEEDGEGGGEEYDEDS